MHGGLLWNLWFGNDQERLFRGLPRQQVLPILLRLLVHRQRRLARSTAGDLSDDPLRR